MAIDFELNDLQKKLQQELSEFSKKEIIPLRQKIDDENKIPEELLNKLLKPPLAIPSIWIPKKYGGKELDLVSICVVTEEIGYACAAFIPFVEACGLATLPILYGAKEEIKNKYLPLQAKGEKYAALCMTEPTCGSDAGAIKLKAEKEGDYYILNGIKRQISEVDIATHFVVSARTDHDYSKKARGVSLFIVDKDTPGIKLGAREHYVGTRGHEAYHVIFDNVKVHKDNMIGEENKGFRILMQVLDKTRLSVSAGALGIARAAYEAAAKYAVVREAFDKKLIDHQAIGFRLAEIATEIDAARLLIYRGAYLSDKGILHTKETSMAKWYATEVAVKAALLSVRVLGGYGVMKGDVERFLRDAQCYLFAQGTTEIQKIIIAREIMREYSKKE